jgi:hypothetical protein
VNGEFTKTYWDPVKVKDDPLFIIIFCDITEQPVIVVFD